MYLLCKFEVTFHSSFSFNPLHQFFLSIVSHLTIKTKPSLCPDAHLLSLQILFSLVDPLASNVVIVQLLNHVSFVTLWTVAHKTPLSMGFPRQKYWSGLLFPSPEDPPDPGIKPVFPALAGGFFIIEPPGKPMITGPSIHCRSSLIQELSNTVSKTEKEASLCVS